MAYMAVVLNMLPNVLIVVAVATNTVHPKHQKQEKSNLKIPAGVPAAAVKINISVF